MESTRERNPLEDRLDRVDAYLYRNRHIAGPPTLAAALTGVAGLAHWLEWEWTLTIATTIVVGWGLDAVRDLPTRREKAVTIIGWLFGAGWAVTTAWLGLSTLLLVLLGVAVLALGIPWARHRRVRRGVDVDKAIEAWGDGSAVGLKGTKARATTAGAGSFSFKITADEPGTYTLSTYQQAKGRIAARFKVRAEAVSFTPTKHEGETLVTIRDKDRVTTEAEVSTETRSIIGPHRVGTTDSGDPIEMAFYLDGRGAQHHCAVGATGSGKSSLVNQGCKITVEAKDALLWVVDMSYGAMELRQWAPACDWFANTTDEVDKMLDALTRMCEEYGRTTPGRLRIPTEDDPAIVLWIDEGASVWAPDLIPADTDIRHRRKVERIAEARKAKGGEVARLVRKYGIPLCQATQYGVDAALGGHVVKQQLTAGYATVFYSSKNTDSHQVIPAGLGVRCAEIPQDKPGTCAVKGPTIDGVVQGRIDYLTDDVIGETVAYWAGKQPTLPPRIAAAGGEPYATRNRTAPQGTSGENPAGNTGESAGPDIPRPASVPDFAAAHTGEPIHPALRLTPDQSRDLVWQTLAGFPDGAGPTEVGERCGKSPPMVRARLTELAAVGRVRKLSRGRYEVMQPAPPPNANSAKANAHSASANAYKRITNR
jgi:hypothetical protein